MMISNWPCLIHNYDAGPFLMMTNGGKVSEWLEMISLLWTIAMTTKILTLALLHLPTQILCMMKKGQKESDSLE